MADVALLAPVAVEASSFDLEFMLLNGSRRRGALMQCWQVRFDRDAAPVRAFASFRGQRSYSGWWWLSASSAHVGFESWLERDNLMVLDADGTVAAVVSQPFWLHWRDGESGRERRHAPDYFVRLRDGSAVVVDVRADDRIEPKDADAFAATSAACRSVGWEYRRVGELEPVLAGNLRWLAGYRHPRNRASSVAAELVSVFATGRPLLEGAAMVGDPLAVLPTLFHLLWTGELITNRAACPLDGDVVVSAGAAR